MIIYYCIYINSFWDWAKIYPYHTHSFEFGFVTEISKHELYKEFRFEIFS